MLDRTCRIGLLLLVSGTALASEPAISRIALGSCAKQTNPQPVWDAILAEKPQLFVFLGDNAYVDAADDLAGRKAIYDQMKALPGYVKLRINCLIRGTWDDHDYGKNDGGAEYPLKQEMQKLFCDFFDLPNDDVRRRRAGVYWAEVFGPPDRRVQLILLDTRSFRGPLISAPWGEQGDGRPGPYVPNPDESVTMLGETQWKWLEQQLRQPAEVRLIASSIQVIANEHRFEKWGNLPHERERLLKLIRETGAKGVLFLSGDRHMAELSRLDDEVDYPLYDLTASALNQSTDIANEANRHRVGSILRTANFGLITIDWEAAEPNLTLEIRWADGKVFLIERVLLKTLGIDLK